MKYYNDEMISIIIDFISKKSKGKVKKLRTIIGISKIKTSILKLKKDELFILFFCIY